MEVELPVYVYLASFCDGGLVCSAAVSGAERKKLSLRPHGASEDSGYSNCDFMTSFLIELQPFGDLKKHGSSLDSSI